MTRGLISRRLFLLILKKLNPIVNFFLEKGADKVGLTSIMKNITDQAKQSFGGVVKNLSNPVSKTVFNATQNATKSVSGSFSNKTT